MGEVAVCGGGGGRVDGLCGVVVGLCEWEGWGYVRRVGMSFRR